MALSSRIPHAVKYLHILHLQSQRLRNPHDTLLLSRNAHHHANSSLCRWILDWSVDCEGALWVVVLWDGDARIGAGEGDIGAAGAGEEVRRCNMLDFR